MSVIIHQKGLTATKTKAVNGKGPREERRREGTKYLAGGRVEI